MTTTTSDEKTALAAAADATLYKYTALPEGSWIRVAALHPCAEGVDDLMQISFINVQIDDPEHQEYVAISYAWGSQILSEPIVCEGRNIKVTATLLAALRDIRQSKEVVYIWADAICINQSGVVERQQQVRFMDRIFAQASEVLVYLGALSATDLNAVATITKFAETDFDHIDFSQKSSLAEMHTYLTECVKDYTLPTVDDDVWQAVERLMVRPWFTRLWIVQEYAMARQVSFIIGHNEFVSADTFRLGAITAVWYHRLLALPIIEKLLSKGFTAAETVALWIPRFSFDKGFYVPIFRLQMHLKIISSLIVGGDRFSEISTFRARHKASSEAISTPMAHRPNPVGLYGDWQSAFGPPWWKYQKHTFFHNFVQTRQFAATDSRDRVYALLGLCSEKGVSALHVDYHQPSWQLAEKISIHFIRRGHGVYMLTGMSLSSKLSKHGWRIALQRAAPFAGETLHSLVSQSGYFENGLFRAGGYEERIDILSDGSTNRPLIAVSGIDIGCITDICKVELPELIKTMMQQNNDQAIGLSWWEGIKMQLKWYNDSVAWIRSIEKWIISQNSRDPSFELNCWRALACEITLNARGQRELISSEPDQFDPGLAVMKCKEAYTSIWSLFWRYMNQNVAVPWDHLTVSSNLQLCMDSAGRICAVPIGSEAGDRICIFKGFPLPFVLRPTSESVYQLLGVAYVRGAMDGDLFDEMWRKHPQSFTLDPGPEIDDV